MKKSEKAILLVFGIFLGFSIASVFVQALSQR